MIKNLIFIFIGGGLGSALRFAFSVLVNEDQIKWIPTLMVNLIGCTLLGLFFGLNEKESFSNIWYLLLATGFCGGLTTFSTFSLEAFQLFKAHQITQGVIYIVVSIVAGILCSVLGYFLSRLIDL